MEDFMAGFMEALGSLGTLWQLFSEKFLILCSFIVILVTMILASFWPIAIFFGLSFVRFWLMNSGKSRNVRWLFPIIKWTVVIPVVFILQFCILNGLFHNLTGSAGIVVGSAVVYVIVCIVTSVYNYQKKSEGRLCVSLEHGSIRSYIAAWKEYMRGGWWDP